MSSHYYPRVPSSRRFDVLGGPGGYLSARHVGAMCAGEYTENWPSLVRVNVPRHLVRDWSKYRPLNPRAVYLEVLRYYRAHGCAV